MTGNAMMARKEKASITLFLSLVLTLVFSLCFSLLEAARVQALGEIATRKLLLEMESMFGEYQPELWKDYGLLFLDGGDEGGKLNLTMLEGRRVEEASMERRNSGFYQMALKNLEITEYALATDHAGLAFERQACAAIQAQLAAGAADALRDKLNKGKDLARDGEGLEKQWESAKDAMTKADEIEKGKEADIDISGNTLKKSSDGSNSDVSKETSAKPPGNLPENPVESVDLLKKSLTLNLVVENPAQISAKAFPVSDALHVRTKAQGSMKLPDGGVLDRFWFLQYLDHYFSCKTGAGKAGSTEHALDYELEYCVAGKGSDYENLETVVKELLLVREAGNFMTIMQDGKKQALALEIATAAVGFTGLAPLIQAVQIGILLAWSYVESIMDVRCLLSGGRVALVKAPSEWKSDVSLGEKAVAEKTEKTQSGKDGLSYREYLQILLLLAGEKALVSRAMDIVERNMMLREPAFRMDAQIHSVDVEALYTASPLFSGFITTGKIKDGTYHLRADCGFAYLK